MTVPLIADVCLVVYLLIAVAASWFLTEGYRLAYSCSGIVMFSLLWPLFLVLLIISFGFDLRDKYFG